MPLTLDDAIAMARVQSADAAVALAELKTAYWQWRSYRADRLPEVTLSGTIPSYNDRYTSYMNQDGEYSFVRSHNLDAQAQVSVDQNIPLTGGKIGLSTSLDYMRQFENGGSDRFLAVPVALTLQQPVFGVNTFKWDNRIEPVRFMEAKAAFLSATEDVALSVVNYFFHIGHEPRKCSYRRAKSRQCRQTVCCGRGEAQNGTDQRERPAADGTQCAGR